MNSQERDQLSQFLQQLSSVKLADKDAEAENLIRETAARQPDATYLLVQRSLLLEQALSNAKSQINALQNQLQNQPAPANSGFLNNDPWAQPANNPAQVPGGGNYQVPRFAAAPSAPASGFGGGSSFLGNVATTAAGVVAGSFLFHGIENLMGHHASSPWGQHDASAINDHPAEQTTINNYYGDDANPLPSHEASYSDYQNVDDSNDFQDDSDSEWI